MESFAFWYKEVNNADKRVEATMNFNLWSQCGWNCEPYLDIGFKVNNLKSAKVLYFFLPFCIEERDKTRYIEDLGCKFAQTELVDAVFNESFATTIAANKKTIKVETTNASMDYQDKQERFYIYQLDVEHDIKLEPFADGTIITIETENIINSVQDQQNEPVYYLRFRIKDHPLGFLIHKYETPHRAIQSLFNTTYMIDFRFHNIRSLHKTLIEKFSKADTKVVGVKSLHFFLMTKAYIDVEIINNDFKGIRKIEKDVWKKYVNEDGPLKNSTEDLLAYHIAQKVSKDKGGKSEQYLASSELFAKFRVERSVIIWYVLLTIFLGAVGSIIATFINEFF